jgi:tetratricopeptide (TPR) repeat protein
MTPDERIGALAAGAVLADRYRLIRRLGSGGMAMVWLAEDERLDRRVAIKIPSDVLAGDRAFLKRFQREARIAASLAHPNLVAVYDYSSQHERPFLVMQYVEGDTLAEIHERGEQLDADALARQLLSALDHIHAAGIVHRDVKPSNVLLTNDGQARLTDFGIAQPEDATHLTQTGQVIGSRGYMAPEVEAGKRATPRSDLYSTGMVLLDHLGPDEGRSLRALVARLTASDPKSRPASAADALEALKQGAAGAETPTDALTEPTATLPQRPPPRARRPQRPATVAITPRRLLAGLVAIGALVGFVALVSGDGDAPQQTPTKVTGEDGGGQDSSAPSAPSDAAGAASGASLNQQGYQLIQQGNPGAAVPVLEQAVASFPEGTGDLNYAYALFNLGQALRLSGRPDEAIPILEQRLQINNQRAEVEAELAKAREAAAAE